MNKISFSNCPLYMYMDCDLWVIVHAHGISTHTNYGDIQSYSKWYFILKAKRTRQSSRNVGCLYNICEAEGWVKCLTLAFRGVKFVTKWLIYILRAPYRGRINSEKFVNELG